MRYITVVFHISGQLIMLKLGKLSTVHSLRVNNSVLNIFHRILTSFAFICVFSWNYRKVIVTWFLYVIYFSKVHIL